MYNFSQIQHTNHNLYYVPCVSQTYRGQSADHVIPDRPVTRSSKMSIISCQRISKWDIVYAARVSNGGEFRTFGALTRNLLLTLELLKTL